MGGTITAFSIIRFVLGSVNECCAMVTAWGDVNACKTPGEDSRVSSMSVLGEKFRDSRILTGYKVSSRGRNVYYVEVSG